MHPGAVDRCHRFGFLALGCRLLVVTFSQQRRDDGVDLLGDETKFLAQFVERLGLHVFRWLRERESENVCSLGKLERANDGL